MTISALCNNLRKKGLDARQITVYNLHDGRQTASAVMVYHDYSGPYPDDAAYSAHNTSTAYARKHGFYSEKRGMTQATLIYEEA